MKFREITPSQTQTKFGLKTTYKFTTDDGKYCSTFNDFSKYKIGDEVPEGTFTPREFTDKYGNSRTYYNFKLDTPEITLLKEINKKLDLLLAQKAEPEDDLSNIQF